MKSITKKLLRGLSMGVIGLMILSCNDQKESDEPVKAPEGVISPKEAKVLNDTYTRTRAGILDSLLGRPDNRSSWWSVEDLRDYLKYAEQQAEEKGYELDGIRIYQGAYPEDYSDQKVAGYGTVFLVPTGIRTDQQKGSLFFNFQNSGDISEISPLDRGHPGNPPHASYPNQ